MSRVLEKTEVGNPILRKSAKRLNKSEISSRSTENLIGNLKHTLIRKKYGIGLAAPQAGKGVALSVIYIRPTKTRPNLPKEKWADLVIINPVIKRKFGKPKQMWEGCVSLPEVFAKVPRFKKIELEYVDGKGGRHTNIFEGLLAHVIQHETDHLNGILFVDRVTDPRTFMTGEEYRKRIVPHTEPE